MQRTDFNYELPQHLIAQYPVEPRTASKLLALDKSSGELQHLTFADLPTVLRPNDLLVFNNTRVIPARLYGEKETGGKVEVLIERVTGSSRGIAQIRASKAPKPGTKITLEKSLSIQVLEKVDDMYLIETVSDLSLEMILNEVGHMPLPPYIEREDEEVDHDRYQTVYAQRNGAVAAPTAGLHFDADLINQLLESGVNIAYVTLHVGAGTFQPVRVDEIETHQMHSEYIEVDAALCNAIRETKERGGRVIAVGTTSVRSLETASIQKGWIEPYFGDTDIFIYPGYEFKMVDAMITNFHLPESTLIMLVSAFAGIEQTKAAYETAVAREYRFFSYGDAMFIQ